MRRNDDDREIKTRLRLPDYPVSCPSDKVKEAMISSLYARHEKCRNIEEKEEKKYKAGEQMYSRRSFTLGRTQRRRSRRKKEETQEPNQKKTHFATEEKNVMKYK